MHKLAIPEQFLATSSAGQQPGVNPPQINGRCSKHEPWYSSLDPRHMYSVPELAKATNLSTDEIRRIFTDCPGVLVVQLPRKRVRVYRTLRIPGHVAIAVFKSMTNGGSQWDF
jgi:hypothetical protein